jgi:hypothetical protein
MATPLSSRGGGSSVDGERSVVARAVYPTKGKRIAGGVMATEKRMNVSVLAGRNSELAVRDVSYMESPGPGSYMEGLSALTPRSARIGNTSRKTSDWLEAECAPGLKTPAPVQYDAENGKISRSKLPQHSASARMLSPRGACIVEKGVVVQDLRRGESPGPGSYEIQRGALSARNSARITEAPRRTEALYRSTAECSPGVLTPGPMSYDTDRDNPSMKHSHSASARMLSPRFQYINHGEFTVHNLSGQSLPGPGSYDTTTGRSALSPRSARVSTAPRQTERWATSRGECSKDLSTPSAVQYDTDAGSRKTSSIRKEMHAVSSARMLSPRGACLVEKGVIVQDLRRGESPGPGTYDTKRGAMSPRSARIGDAVRRTASWAQAECAPGLLSPSPADYTSVLTYEDASSSRRSIGGLSSRGSLRSGRRSPRSSHASLAATPMSTSRHSPMKELREVDGSDSHEASTRADSHLVFNSPGTSNTATPVRQLSYLNPTYSSENKRAYSKLQPHA